MTAPRVGFSVIYGTSDNGRLAVSNAHATHIGYRPKDSADGYIEKVLADTERSDPNLTDNRIVGGWFASVGHPDDE